MRNRFYRRPATASEGIANSTAPSRQEHSMGIVRLGSARGRGDARGTRGGRARGRAGTRAALIGAKNRLAPTKVRRSRRREGSRAGRVQLPAN